MSELSDKEFNITVNNMSRILMGKRQKYARTEGDIKPVRKKFYKSNSAVSSISYIVWEAKEEWRVYRLEEFKEIGPPTTT